MQTPSASPQTPGSGRVVVIGTGGTIAGTAARPQDQTGYTAGALGVQALIDAIPALAAEPLESIALAQIDSSDMDHATWQRLAVTVAQQLARPEVQGVVITHGTDTLEESAYFLHRVIAADKAVVFTAAMRPATALSPDGPQNLFDAITLARWPGTRGVMAVLNGRILSGAELRKVHGHAVQAFETGDAGPLGLIEDGVPRFFRDGPQPPRHAAAAAVLAGTGEWPAVDIVTSHAGARGEVVAALVAAGARGLVFAGTGNGSLHAALEAAARVARRQGVRVLRASRCPMGGVVGGPEGALPSAGPLTVPQARIELMLDLIAAADPG